MQCSVCCLPQPLFSTYLASWLSSVDSVPTMASPGLHAGKQLSHIWPQGLSLVVVGDPIIPFILDTKAQLPRSSLGASIVVARTLICPTIFLSKSPSGGFQTDLCCGGSVDRMLWRQGWPLKEAGTASHQQGCLQVGGGLKVGPTRIAYNGIWVVGSG